MKKTTEFIKNLIKRRDRALVRKTGHLHPYDFARVFPGLQEAERRYLYENLPPKRLAEIFSYLETDDTIAFLKEIGIDGSIPILEQMASDDVTDILNEIDDDDFRAILGRFSMDAQEELAYLREYDEDQVGAVMTTNYIAVEADLDVKEAMRTLVREAAESESIDPIYVTVGGKLDAVIKLTDLIIARSPQKIGAIADKMVVSIDVRDKAADAAAKMNNYGLSVLPVVDDGELVGIVTIDDAMDVVEREETETYGQLAAVTIDEDATFKVLLRRVPWLLTLLALGFMLSGLISAFEDVIRQVTALVFFQTMVLGMVGNVSTQSLAVSIRHLVRNDLNTTRKTARHLFKELRVALVNAVICAVFAFAVSFAVLAIKKTADKEMIALVVALSIMVALIIGGMIGAVAPIIFSKLKIDPTLASGPLIITLNDLITVVIYFGLASVLLGLI